MKIVLKLTVSVHIRIINFFIASKLGIPWTHLLICWNITWSRLAEIADENFMLCFPVMFYKDSVVLYALFWYHLGNFWSYFFKVFVWKQIKGI
jgi:hypothetical protein